MSGDVTPQALKRISQIPDRPSEYEGGTMIAGQEYDNVNFVGGSISGITPSGLPTPLAIEDGGTGQITANAALNALLPTQTGNSGKVLKTDGSNTSWSTDTDTGITQLTGDVTAGPGSGSQAATLATVNSNVGSFGSSTSIPSFTVNAKGLITAASGNAVIAPAGTLTGNTLASGVTASSLTSVGTLSSLTMGGTLAMGTNNITSTGSLGATGARLTKGWFTDLQVTNAIAGSITGNAATVTTNANLTGAVTSVGNATSLGSFTSAQLATALTDETGTGANVFATTPTISQPDIVGTTTNNNANAGSVGQIIESTVLSASAVSITSSTAADVTSISLTAGDWDVWANIATLNPGTTTISSFTGWINTTSATFPTIPNGGAYFQFNVNVAAGNNLVFPTGTTRLSLASTTTVYLSGFVTFAASTLKLYGYIGARRRR